MTVTSEQMGQERSRTSRRRPVAILCAAAAITACGSAGGGEFNEDAARDAAIEWNPGNVEGVQELVDRARELCGDREQIERWVTLVNEYTMGSSEQIDIYNAACPETIADVARELALPVPD